jgi:pyrroloquinoline quinone biosynthesis protein D
MTHVTPRQQQDSELAGNPPSATERLRRSEGMKGKTAPLRRTIRLAARYQLRTGPSRDGSELVSPNGPIQINETAAAVLGMCNGKHTAEEIVTRVLRLKEGDLAEDIRAFLDAAQRRGWIVKS